MAFLSSFLIGFYLFKTNEYKKQLLTDLVFWRQFSAKSATLLASRKNKSNSGTGFRSCQNYLNTNIIARYELLNECNLTNVNCSRHLS